MPPLIDFLLPAALALISFVLGYLAGSNAGYRDGYNYGVLAGERDVLRQQNDGHGYATLTVPFTAAPENIEDTPYLQSLYEKAAADYAYRESNDQPK